MNRGERAKDDQDGDLVKDVVYPFFGMEEVAALF